MRKILIIGGTVFMTAVLTFVFIEAGNKIFPRKEFPTMDEGSIIAENWVKNFSSLYPLYGEDLQIIEKKEIEEGEYEFVFSFRTNNPEYGSRENQIVINTRDTEVVFAVTNDIYDEIAEKYIEEEQTLEIYFVIFENGESDEGKTKKIESVERAVAASAIEEVERILLEEMLKGPTPEEVEGGYVTFIERGTSLFSFRIENGVAYIELSIDFDNQPEIAQKQIEKTLAQFDNITTVEAPKEVRIVTVTVEGIPDEFLFERDLKEGDENIDVEYLQMVLNADPETMVADEGPGSPGEEGRFFSTNTRNAVASFQRKYSDNILRPAGLIISTGVVCENTRDMLNAILEENRI